MNDSDLSAAAYHEAGHAAVAQALDGQAFGLQIFWSEHNRWFGDTKTKLCQDSVSQFDAMCRQSELSAVGVQIAIAGMLAQAKHGAIQKFGLGISFDPNSDSSAILGFIDQERLSEDQPGEITFHFSSPNQGIVSQTFSGHCFSGMDQNYFRYYRNAGGDLNLADLLSQTMELIDDPVTWKTIEEIAALALSQPEVGSERRRSLSREQLQECLTRGVN